MCCPADLSCSLNLYKDTCISLVYASFAIWVVLKADKSVLVVFLLKVFEARDRMSGFILDILQDAELLKAIEIGSAFGLILIMLAICFLSLTVYMSLRYYKKGSSRERWRGLKHVKEADRSESKKSRSNPRLIFVNLTPEDFSRP